MKTKYWKNYYNDDRIVATNDLQKNIGRTRNGIVVSQVVWVKTINYIASLLDINDSLDVVELACGNGQVIGHLASKCKNAIGVDYSSKLLKQMDNNFKAAVKAIEKDIMEVSFGKESIDIVIIYFSIQHFTEKETILLISNALVWLRQGGKLFIGDIPNELQKWEYINKPEYKKDYLLRVLNDEPMIGNWFHPDFFRALISYFTNISLKIIEQPKYQMNSSYRFDVLIEKV